MPIQYTPNAAAISWLALSQALDSRANMEGHLLNLFAQNTALSITQTENQASNAQRNMEDQANLAMKQGIMGIVGAGVGAGTAAFSTMMQNTNMNKAAQLDQTDEFTLQEKTKPIISNANEVEMDTFIDKGSIEIEGTIEQPTNSPTSLVQETSISAEPNNAQESVKISGKNSPTNSTGNTTAKTEQQKDNQASDNATLQKKYEANANWWLQNGSSFASLANQLLNNGVSNLLQINTIKDQGKAQAAQNIAQGLSAVFNAQSSQLSSAVSSCDSYMQNTNSIISTLIQTSAIRG